MRSHPKEFGKFVTFNKYFDLWPLRVNYKL